MRIRINLFIDYREMPTDLAKEWKELIARLSKLPNVKLVEAQK